MPDDRLDAITAALEVWAQNGVMLTDDERVIPKPSVAVLADLRWLVDEVRRLRQGHAEAVEAAFREGATWGMGRPRMGPQQRWNVIYAAWLASEARKGVA